jgi:hypothetical protein
MSTINPTFSCLEGLVGITNSDCECLGTIDPSYKQSSKSIFIDELLNPLIELKYNNCNETNANAWEGIASKRIDAINSVGNEISLRITEKYDKQFNAFDILIGRNTFSSADYSNTAPKLIFKTKNIAGFQLMIHKIGLLINSSRTVTVTVKKTDISGIESTVRTVILNTTNSTPHLFTIKTNDVFDPIILNCDGSTYEFSFPLSGFSVLDNLIYHTCSKCNDDLPPFTKFLDCDFRNINKNRANGFLLETKGFCDIEKLLCLIISEAPELSFLLGKIIAYKTALLSLQSAKISSSQFNLIARNDIEETIVTYEKEYYSNINRFLKADLPTINKSCFCKSSKSPIAVR